MFKIWGQKKIKELKKSLKEAREINRQSYKNQQQIKKRKKRRELMKKFEALR